MQALERRSQLQGEKSPGGLPWKIKVAYLSDQTTVHMITKCFRIESFEEESDEDEKPGGVKGQKTEVSDEVFPSNSIAHIHHSQANMIRTQKQKNPRFNSDLSSSLSNTITFIPAHFI